MLSEKLEALKFFETFDTNKTIKYLVDFWSSNPYLRSEFLRNIILFPDRHVKIF